MQTEDRHLYERLMAGDPALQRDFSRVLQAFGIALLVLHVSVAASVIPYAYVNDPMANCGARMILDQFGSDVGVILGLLVAARLLAAFYHWHWVLPPPPPDTGLFRWGKLIFAALSGALILASLFSCGLITIHDLEFLSAPPVIRRTSTLCPEVDWTSKVQSDIPRAVAKPTTLVVGLL